MLQRLVPVEVRVWFPGRVERVMGMAMVLIVHVGMDVRRVVVDMLVFVMFGQVQPYANRHQGTGDKELRGYGSPSTITAAAPPIERRCGEICAGTCRPRSRKAKTNNARLTP